MSLLDNGAEPVEAAHGAGEGGLWCDSCSPPREFRNRNALTAHRKFKHPDLPPPRRGRPPKKDSQPAAPKKPAGGARLRSLRAELEVAYAFPAQFWQMRDPVCGSVALEQVPKIALAWDTWAQSSPKVHAAIEKALAGSGALGVALAHAPIVMIVLAHHGPDKDRYFPAGPPPEEAPTVEQPVMNGEGAWPQSGPTTSEYAPASADRAR